MDHDEFIGQVQQRGRLDSRGAAEQATRATLQSLGERLGGGAPSNIGAQLPPEIGRYLSEQDDRSERFDVTQFYERVAERETSGIDAPQAALHSRAVLSVVRDAVDASLFDKLEQQLPPELQDLLDFGDLEAGTD